MSATPPPVLFSLFFQLLSLYEFLINKTEPTNKEKKEIKKKENKRKKRRGDSKKLRKDSMLFHDFISMNMASGSLYTFYYMDVGSTMLILIHNNNYIL